MKRKLYIYSVMGLLNEHGAIKSCHSLGFTEALSEAEAKGLAIERFEAAKDGSGCPIGSVTAMEITDAELEKFIKNRDS